MERKIGDSAESKDQQQLNYQPQSLARDLTNDLGLEALSLTRGLSAPATTHALDLDREDKMRSIAAVSEIPGAHLQGPVYKAVHAGPSLPTASSSAYGGFDMQKQPFSGFDTAFGSTAPWMTGNALSGKELTSPMAFGIPQDTLRPPVALGGYLEPHYHFYSEWPAAQIMDQLHDTLRSFSPSEEMENDSVQFRIDTDKHPSKFKFKCIAYSLSGGSSTQFVVRVFSLEDSSVLAVEFQRRCGDPIQFCTVYRACLSQLQSCGCIDDKTSQLPQHCMFEPPKFQGIPRTEAEQAKDAKETLTCLLQMLGSKCVDVQAEAAGSLADLANQPSMHEHMLRSNVLEAFCKAASSESVAVHRCAVTGLANLTNSETQKEQACKKVVQEQCVNVVVALTRSSTLQVQREAARLLANISSVGGLPLCGKESIQEMRQQLENLRTSGDRRVRDHGIVVLNSLASV